MRQAQDTQAITHISVLLAKDRNNEILTEEELDKVMKALEHIALVLTKHVVNVKLNEEE